MKEYLLQLKTQILELWNKMTRYQKIVIIVSALLLVGTLAFLVRGATRPDFAPLFTQLAPEDAAQTVEYLKTNNIPYQLTDGGSTIMVPGKDVDSTRIALSSEGFPTGGVVGFESFDQTKFGETETDRRARYLRALQGELTRTIERFSEVDKARVHIVLPEPSLFLEQEKSATAAIWLQLKPNHSLKPEHVKGLVSLVTNSVEGLTPDNVTVVDMNGNILTESLDFSEDAVQQRLSATQMELQDKYQTDLQRDLQTMLDKIVGIGKAVVRVRAELDFDRIERKIRDIGDDKHVISEQKSETTSNSTNTSPPQAGTGTDGNIPGYVETNQNSSSESSSSDVIRNMEYDTEEVWEQVAPGSVDKLSVSVVIDNEIDQQMQDKITKAITAAANIDAERGDQISVTGIPFNTEYQEEVQTQFAEAEKRQNYMFFGSIAAVLLLIIVVFIIRARMLKRERLDELGEIAETPMPIADIEEMVQEKEMTPEEKEKTKIKEQVESVANQNPEDVAQLLKSWLAEE